MVSNLLAQFGDWWSEFFAAPVGCVAKPAPAFNDSPSLGLIASHRWLIHDERLELLLNPLEPWYCLRGLLRILRITAHLCNRSRRAARRRSTYSAAKVVVNTVRMHASASRRTRVDMPSCVH